MTLSTKNLFDISEEIIIVTGVSGQLGYQYAKFLLENGSKVFGLDLFHNKKITDLIKLYKEQFIFFKSDITKKDELLSVSKKMIDTFGYPTVLINNAGIDTPPPKEKKDFDGNFENFPEEEWDKVLEVNLKGTYLCSQVFGSLMSKKNKGSIINISSIYGVVSPNQKIYDYLKKEGKTFFKPISYSVSKSGIINFTKYLSTYWAKKNVRVNTLTIAGVYNFQDPEFVKAYTDLIPIGRMANKDEYCGAILFLASKASSYMTGSNLVVDGGWTSI